MDNAVTSLQRLESYLESVDFQGYDCYDALNSPLLASLSSGSRWLRIAFIQGMKKSPINFRPLLGVPTGHNPKGLGLFLSASSWLYRKTQDTKYLKRIEQFVGLLAQLASPTYSGMCWGYNFDWQSRAFYIPKYTPTVVNTSFIGHALLDAFQVTSKPEYLQMARSACDFILNDLHRTPDDDGAFSFSYTPLDRTCVHNANILGAALLARVSTFTGEDTLADEASCSARYVLKRQREDGSWYYADTAMQSWIDNFHTGFILESLAHVRQVRPSEVMDRAITIGYRYFLGTFFLNDGTPKYYSDRTYPIDIHSCAESVVVLSKLSAYDDRSQDLLDRVLHWTLLRMQDPRGFFYFQKHAFFTNRIPYIRWAQAWMYYALAHTIAARNGALERVNEAHHSEVISR